MKHNEQKPNFLSLVNGDIRSIIVKYKNSLPGKAGEMEKDLRELVGERLKQSFRNGIEVGSKRTSEKD
jgi:hypothetical protein